MTRYIVKMKGYELYFSGLGLGVTYHREEAGSYSPEELTNLTSYALIKKGAFVLIPVGSNNDGNDRNDSC